MVARPQLRKITWTPYTKYKTFKILIQFYLSMSHSTLPLACHAQSIPFCKTGILLCWHLVSWLGKQSSLRCSEVSLSLVFQTTAGADGRPNVTETTSEAGYSSVPVALLQQPPHPTTVVKQAFGGLVGVWGGVSVCNDVVTNLSSDDSWTQRPAICWRSCRTSSTRCWMSSAESSAPGERSWACVDVHSGVSRLPSTL